MHFHIKRYEKETWSELEDCVADEEPLQITLDGSPIAVVMRTPGHDIDLVRGFLLTEGILTSLEGISRIDLEQKKNHALVFLKDELEVDLSKLKRNLYSASSCGICGKASIEAVVQNTKPITSSVTLSEEVILAAPEKLRGKQAMFDSTGGIHAAALFSIDGELLEVREDVGRHNAVDKVIGDAAQRGMNMSETFLQVSGRVSFEVIQKALMVGIPAVSAISAPSSLAIEFARETNMQLFGFVRGGKFNKYA